MDTEVCVNRPLNGISVRIERYNHWNMTTYIGPGGFDTFF